MVLDPRRFVLRTDCENIESELNVAKGDVTKITAEVASGASNPNQLTSLLNRIAGIEQMLADCLNRRVVKEQPTPTPIIFGTPTETGMEQPQRKPLSLKQLAIIGGVILLLL